MIIFQSKALLSQKDLAKYEADILRQAETGVIIINKLFDVIIADDKCANSKEEYETNAFMCHDCGNMVMVKNERHEKALVGKSCEKCGSSYFMPSYIGIDLSPKADTSNG
jgi:predicted RNA-binding Zn-ribbon protein involved in translation (DUF1610 family)